MTYAEFQQQVLSMIASGDEAATVASTTLQLGLDADRSQRYLERMVDDEVLELDSFDDGTLCYRAPGLQGLSPGAAARHRPGAVGATLPRQPSPGARRALTIGAILSVMDFVGVGIAALIVSPHWEAEVLMYVALVGAPGTLAVLVKSIYRLVT